MHLRPLLAALVAWQAACALSARADVVVERRGSSVALRNARVCVEYDLASGLVRALEMPGRRVRLRGLRAVVDDLDTSAPVWQRTCSVQGLRDRLGVGKRLRVQCTAPDRNTVIVDLSLYDGSGAIIAAAGLQNRSPHSVRVLRICPLTGGEAFPDCARTDERTLDGNGGSGNTTVERGASRSSMNNLLLTFREAGRRRSLVLGGLTYHDFVKRVRIGAGAWSPSERRAWIGKGLPSGARLLAYRNCGAPSQTSPGAGPHFERVRGTPFVWSGADAHAPEWFGSVDFHDRAVEYDLTGLDPARRYAIGFSWWDYDDNGRVESVTASADGRKWDLGLTRMRLPAWRDRRQLPDEWIAALPQDATRGGRLRLSFSNDAGTPNAVVSEVWLLELTGPALQYPLRLMLPRPRENARAAVPIAIEATDPVGRLVGPGETYLPDDRFLVDFTTADPFEALERYGQALRRAGGIRPNPYDFPTVCAWYVGIFGVPGVGPLPAQSRYGIAATPGLVEEMRHIAASGFLRYARAAVRLVPDTYAADNEQGWWDDEHWARFGHYLPPYDTSERYAQAVRSLGGLPFTYFQVAHESRDFRRSHPGLLLGKDPARSLDYSNPATQAHMRAVFARLRAAGMAGLMFDYPDDGWLDIARGGLADPKATTASTYRTIFSLAKEGLGPNSWIHERILGAPFSDLTMGAADSQRVVGDTSAIDPGVVSRSGLRWYKNRVVFAYDMDAKDLRVGWKHLGAAVSDRDGRRMLLTMASVAASRLLLATSFRDMDADTLHDLTRTFPYPQSGPAARPVDAFVADGLPRVYDQPIAPGWHVVTLYNNTAPARPLLVEAPLAAAPGDGGLGLPISARFHVYDFWNDRYVGILAGSGRLRQTLRPGEARVLAVQAALDRPQVLSTDQHILQGALDLVGPPVWDRARRVLVGRSRVIADEPYRLIVAENGHRLRHADCEGGVATLRERPDARGLVEVTLRSARGGVVRWTVW